MRAGRRPGLGGLIIVALLVVVIAAFGLSRFYTDFLWFQEVGLTDVLWTSLGTQLAVGLIVGLVTGLIVFLNLTLAGRLAPTYILAERFDRPDPLDRYRALLSPYLVWLRLGVGLFVGLIAGLSAGAAWRLYLLWENRVDFGIEDPQFGKDVGFFVFELPFYNEVLDWAWFALIASVVVSAAAHYFHGSIRPERRLEGVSSGALAHLSVLLGLLALVKSAQYWFGTYGLNFSPRGVVTGASYTDVHAQLPALRLLAIISIISALLFLVNIRFRRVSLPLAAVGIWILTSVLAGGLWPLLVQRFSVEPQELQREAEFMDHNITATRSAFGLSDVETRSFPASADLAPEDIEANADLLQNVRLWDPGVLKLAYEQLQAIRTYYEFHDVDIDRYEIAGDPRQVLLAARELVLDDLPEDSKTWANVHLQYTHGFGLVASLANEATTAGQPDFLVKDVPGTVDSDAPSLSVDQPRLYYGESFESDQYSIVNTDQQELDFPTEAGAERSSYEGEGGVSVGSFFRRLAFAVRESDPNLVLSNLIDSDSQILFYRNVRDRVLRAAPFLSLDHDPYPAVVAGRMVWIIDAYTSTRWYPYSQRFDAGGLVDSAEPGTLDGQLSYVRNSVKVVVDAYDGTMDFYIVDETDPLIQAWRKAFPDLFTAGEPSDELRAHFRYPEDLFKIQTEVYLRYHITDTADFYSKEDEWSIPRNPRNAGSTLSIELPPEFPPLYLLIKLPGETDQEFFLTRPFTPRARNNLIAMMAARSDPEGYGELLTLQFPRQVLVQGPIQINNLINQDVELSRTLSLLRQGGSKVDFGALVSLPLDDSLLYIQPLFVTAEDEQGSGIPELKIVVLVFGEEVVMADSFDEALALLFELEEPEPAPTPGPSPTVPPEDGEEPGRLDELIARAGRIYDRAQAALADGDFATYGQLIEKLGRLLTEAERLAQ